MHFDIKLSSLKSAIPMIDPFDVPSFNAAKRLKTLLRRIDLLYGTFVKRRYPALRNKGGGDGNVLIIVVLDLPAKRVILCYYTLPELISI